MTPQDRELLELAARAARIVTYRSDTGLILRDGAAWNPLTDDGDRYRLARSVKGNLYFNGSRGAFEIPSDGDGPPILEYFTIGNAEEEGRAIVRAAAESGRAMG